MRKLLAVLALGLIGALVLVGRAADDLPPQRPGAPVGEVSAAPVPPVANEPPLLRWTGERRVQPASPRTLKPIAKPIVLPLPMGEGVLSPDGRRAVFHAHDPADGRLMVLELASGRVGEPVDVGGDGLGNLTWLTNERFLGFDGDETGTELVEVDAVRRRVVSRRRFRADVLTTARTRDGVVALLAPPNEIGRARLLIRRPGRPDRTIRTLRWVRAGRVRGERATVVQPGLAVDPDRGIAYVVDAETDRLAEVDLETGTQREGPLARAAKVIDSRVRYAAWLGDGKLAVAGHHDRPDGTIDPHGLRIVDVEDDRRPQRMLTPRQDFLAAGAGRLVAWELKGGGIAIFDRDGRRVRRLLRGARVTHADVHGAYAYVHTQNRDGRDSHDYVVELASGRTVGRGRANVAALASTAAARDTVLGVSYPAGGQGRIARYDPVTLRRQSPGAVVHGYLWDSDQAPGGGRVALGVSNRGRIEIFDARDPRRARRIEVGGRMAVHGLRWPVRDRLLALVNHSVLEIDVPTGRVLATWDVGPHAYARARTEDGLAVLTGPDDGEGHATLVLLRAGAKPRRIELPTVRAALHAHRTAMRPDDPPDLIPGLAVDGNVAYVAPPGPESIVRVDLGSGKVTSHAFRARAAKGGASRSRQLQVLGDGRLLRTGHDVDHKGYPRRSVAEIVDTATWRTRSLGDRVAGAVGSPAGIVVPRYRERFLTVHAPDGRQLARLDPRFGISAVRIHGDHAYVANGARRGRNHRTHVIDLRTGRRVRTLPFSTLPILLE